MKKLSVVFGNNIRIIRTYKRISQKDMAKALKMSQPTIAQWETGKKSPKLNDIQVVADFLKVTPAQLMEPVKVEFGK
jgi:transcriptional regulator with XRE-family HTH domain